MNYYKSIFENFPFPCVLFEKKNNHFIIKEANSSYCTLTYRTAANIKGKIIDDVFPENPSSPGLSEVHECLRKSYSEKKAQIIKKLRYDVYDTERGEFILKYWETEYMPIYDDIGKKTYILNIVKDITEKVLEQDRSKMLQDKLDNIHVTHDHLREKITDGLFSLDREGNFVSLNKGLIDIVETPEEEVLKMNFLPFCGKEHREEIVRRFNAAIEGENQKFEAHFISAKGRNMILEISLVPSKNDDIITGLYSIAKDITKLKESEEALNRSERKFKALVQEGSDIIGILDSEGRYKFVSETSTSILGIRPVDFIGKIAFDYIHPEDLDRVLAEFSELQISNQVHLKPFRFKNAKEEWRWLETIATNLLNDPAIEGIVANSRDITDHINSQKTIRESEERYRSLFENSIDAIMITVPDGEILAANPSACKMFQRSEEELRLLGREAIADPQDPRLAKALALRKEKGLVNLELNFIRKDGTKFPGELTSSIFLDSDRNQRTSVIIRDITQRKITENNLLELNRNLSKNTDELISANKGLEQFSYIISHNLRAPVANILGLTQLLTEDDYSEEIKKNLRKEIHFNAHRLDKVIKDLNQILQAKNDFSEIKQTLYLDDIVESIKVNLQDSITKENFTINTDFAEINKIKSIKSFIYSICYNLILNSIKFRKPDVIAELNISSTKEDGIIRLVFQDNGLGLDVLKKKDEVFGLYKRFHSHVEGKGMGLFMVKTQVEMLGGKIRLESEINKGATFIIEFSDINVE